MLLTKYDGHLSGGSFDPNRMIEMLQAGVKSALDAGFMGLCAAGDMSWILDGAPGSEKVAEYEMRLNRFYEANHALGLCQYNVRTMPAEVLAHCLASHSHIRVDGPILLSNPFFELPESTIKGIAQPLELSKQLQKMQEMQAPQRVV